MGYVAIQQAAETNTGGQMIFADFISAVMNGRTELPVSYRQKEQKAFAAGRYKLCDEYYSLKDEIPNMEAIRRSIKGLMKDEPNRTQPTHRQDVTL